MKKAFLFIAPILLFWGCASKDVTIEMLQKPNSIDKDKISKIKNIKIDYLNNDYVGLTDEIVNQMQEVNKIIPNYFLIDSPNAKSYLSGYVKTIKKDITYKKSLPLDVDGEVCMYKLYPCAEKGGSTFCKEKPSTILSPASFSKIKKTSYKSKNYILYKGSIYKVSYYCKPTHKEIECEKKSLTLFANLAIKSKKKTLFIKNYHSTYSVDACENVKNYQNKDTYKAFINQDEVMPKLKKEIAKEFVYDLAPHKVKVKAKIFTKPDVDMTSKDEKLFKNIISKFPNNSYEEIQQLKTLLSTYPDSCVIKYDLALMLITKNSYLLATELLNSAYYGVCDSDIKKEILKISKFLQNSY